MMAGSKGMMMNALSIYMALAVAVAMAAAPAAADEVEAAMEAALEAYRAGDVSAAKQELDYASTLLAQQKAASLSGFLPEPLEGWTREDGDANAMPAGLFGGGLMAGADYTDGNERLNIQLMADNQMVAGMGAMLTNPQMMGQMGKVQRVKRQMVVVTNEGEVQSMINNRILVQITGNAAPETKLAYFERIDIDALKDF